jgi:hypothetical protein
MARIALVVLLALGGCGKGHSFTYTVLQVDGGCPSASSIVDGPRSDGEACTSDSDCKVTCCPCTNGDGRNWLARVCFDNACNAAEGCAVTVEEPAGENHCP